MKSESFENVWDAVEPEPEQAEHLRLRAGLRVHLTVDRAA